MSLGSGSMGASSSTEVQVDVDQINANTDELEAKADTSNAELAAIKTAVEILDNAISGNEMQVDVVTSALPTGAATETTLAAADTKLDAIKTAVEILDNAIAGTEMQVDVVTSALPTGAATETTLDAIKTAVEILDNAVAGTEMQVDVVTSALPTGASTSANQDTELKRSFGGTGASDVHVINGTATYAVTFHGIQVIKAITLSALTDTNLAGDSLATATLEPGYHPIAGTSITTTGAVGLAYLIIA